MKITIIGFGEAGPVLGKNLADSGMQVFAYDILQDNAEKEASQRAKTTALGIVPVASSPDAVREADLVISTVTASEAINAARQAAPGLQPGCHWLDLNSVSPDTKASIRECVVAQGATFTEGVAMDTIPARGIQVPILLCGPQSMHWSEQLNAAGMNTRSLGIDYGIASSTKLIRSILMKGFEALFAEAMEAAGKLGVQQDVLASVQATYPGLDWQAVAGYQLSRASLHAKRRAAEMRESARLLESLGVEPIMASATATRQQDLADREIGLKYTGESVSDFIAAVRT